MNYWLVAVRRGYAKIRRAMRIFGSFFPSSRAPRGMTLPDGIDIFLIALLFGKRRDPSLLADSK